MIVGFVNAGAMSLIQATAMIMGANIGTTITAQIAALGSFDVALYATLLSIVGMTIYVTVENVVYVPAVVLSTVVCSGVFGFCSVFGDPRDPHSKRI